MMMFNVLQLLALDDQYNWSLTPLKIPILTKYQIPTITKTVKKLHTNNP